MSTNSYNFNSIPNVAPVGSIAPYAGTLTDAAVPGWLICDGASRTNTNGIYNSLINANIYYNNVNPGLNTTYAPPQINSITNNGTTLNYIIKY
uniref:Phage tail collar domain-containing protein n=1 Tax=viral metagenome TaxID=1070528 RepID=A0A6C0JJQ2_9ZZZZ